MPCHYCVRFGKLCDHAFDTRVVGGEENLGCSWCVTLGIECSRSKEGDLHQENAALELAIKTFRLKIRAVKQNAQREGYGQTFDGYWKKLSDIPVHAQRKAYNRVKAYDNNVDYDIWSHWHFPVDYAPPPKPSAVAKQQERRRKEIRRERERREAELMNQEKEAMVQPHSVEEPTHRKKRRVG